MLINRKIYLFIWMALLGVAVMTSLFSCTEKEDIIKEDPPKPFERLIKEQKFRSTAMSYDINYQVLLPAEYENSTDSFPVVYLLHGLGDDETAWTIGGLLQYYVDLYAATSVPMIYVMPEGFNSYYVNRYNKPKNYMHMFAHELVPLIDSLYRTKRSASQRAVMGYSMGGYGAFILPVKNPEIFKTGVVLSMSFRTNEQYLSEPQNVYDYQWSPIFGGGGATGQARFTEYFKQHSPFQFLLNPADQSLQGLNLLFDCGDDEESLSFTNNELHQMLNDRNIAHEYRMRSGGHEWSYWRKSYYEALKFISYAVQQIPYPDQSDPVEIGTIIADNKILQDTLANYQLNYRLVLPDNYLSTTNNYPVLIILHQMENDMNTASKNMLSLLVNQMNANKLSQSILVEIPLSASSASIPSSAIEALIAELKTDFRVANDSKKWVLLGNGNGGKMAYNCGQSLPTSIGTCLLFDANLLSPFNPQNQNQIYYLDICDKGANYQVNNQLYSKLRENNIPYEYRIRQGTTTENDFLKGVYESIPFIHQQIH